MPLYVEMSGDQPTRFFFSAEAPSPRSNSRILLADGDKLVDPLRTEEGQSGLQALDVIPRSFGSVAVVVTCHDKYLKWLPQCMRSIDAQKDGFSTKVLVLDRTDLPDDISSEGWKIIKGDWGTPNPGRNAGLENCDEEWVVFFDADNMMSQGYAEGMIKSIERVGPEVSFIYPDIRICDQDMRPIRYNRTPEWSDLEIQRGNFIDTSSAWRREALKSVGGWGWSQPTEDDYYLAMRMMHRGWRGSKGSDLPPTLYREHLSEQGRWSQAWSDDRESEALWLIREILVLIDVKSVDWICSQSLPEKGRVVVFCGSESGTKTSATLERVALTHPQMTVEVRRGDMTPDAIGRIVSLSSEDIIYVTEKLSWNDTLSTVLEATNSLMPPSHVPDLKDPSLRMDGPRYVAGVKTSAKSGACILAVQGWVARQVVDAPFQDFERAVRDGCISLGITFREVD